jgi:predicted nucleic acid-binding protein
MEDWVFVDTCIWASFFTRPSSREKLAVDELLAHDRVALLGPVVAEVLRGFRRHEQAEWAGSRLRLAHYVTVERNDWYRAAELGREQASLGRDLPITDLALAAVALRLEAYVYTTDPHFDGIDGLKRFWPI